MRRSWYRSLATGPSQRCWTPCSAVLSSPKTNTAHKDDKTPSTLEGLQRLGHDHQCRGQTGASSRTAARKTSSAKRSLGAVPSAENAGPRKASAGSEHRLRATARTIMPYGCAAATSDSQQRIQARDRTTKAPMPRRRPPAPNTPALEGPSVAVTTADVAVLSQRHRAARATQHVRARLSRSPWTAAQADDALGARPPMRTRAHAHEPRPFQT